MRQDHEEPFSLLPDAPLAVTDPFLRRIFALVAEWVETEWANKQVIKREIETLGASAQRAIRLRDATLCPQTLARAADNVSVNTLQRELRRLETTPGALIKRARLLYGRRLLTHTRFKISEIAERCGYENERSYSNAFAAEFGQLPSRYRRQFSADNDTTQS